MRFGESKGYKYGIAQLYLAGFDGGTSTEYCSLANHELLGELYIVSNNAHPVHPLRETRSLEAELFSSESITQEDPSKGIHQIELEPLTRSL